MGFHRVLKPRGVLPQAAERLDTSLPIYSNEVLIEVEKLHIDSASFLQLRQEAGDYLPKLEDRILQITKDRGKLQNPVTGSGGMLLGTVVQVGPEAPENFKVGARVATLVSLTLTPLSLEKIFKTDLRGGQVRVQGKAILFASGVVAPLPEDLVEDEALALFDVCGAPARVHRMVRHTDRVLILGAGKAGVLSALAAMEVVPPESVWLSDIREEVLDRVRRYGWGVNTFPANVQEVGKFQENLEVQKIPLFDLVVNTCNVPETETASILATRPGGRILFFNMATQFARVVLSAEGIARDIEMIMGNGFVEGHADFALKLFRKHSEIHSWFQDSG